MSIAGTATIAFLAIVGGCTQQPVYAPAPIAYWPPAHPARHASRPRVPQPPPAAPGAAEPASAPALSEEDKANLFQRFDAWESSRAGAPASTPVAGSEPNP